jgi:hypothetical protein
MEKLFQTFTLTLNTKLVLTGVWQKWRCSASYDSFVGKQTLLLRLKFSAKTPRHRKPPKRYAAA